MLRLWNCAFGPQLYRFFDARDVSQIYQQNFMEAAPNYFLTTAEFVFGIAKWGWPFYMPYVVKRLMNTTVERVRVRSVTYTVYSAGVLCLLMCAVLLRGVGRALNPTYTEFIAVLGRAQRSMSTENKTALSRFDFEFWAWPVEFDASSSSSVTAAGVGQSRRRRRPAGADPDAEAAGLGGPSDWFMRACTSAIVHTVGIRLTYPGCTSLMNAAARSFVQQARARLRTEHRAERFKLHTAGGHEVELFFADKRGFSGGNGATLVVCCEGNAAYPEIGATGVPLDAGYSVIGWHHPGFGGSTGLPFPETEREFMHTVLLFAQEQLNFRLQDTVVLAWSIGGYTATWAGASNPDIKYLVLDATFDGIEELAVKAMPKFASGLVRETIKRQMNLDNAAQLCRYPGPVKLIRRSQDEMITTGTPDQVHTNRGNDLLLALLRHRYPNLITQGSLAAVHQFLGKRKSAEVQQYLRSIGVTEAECVSLLRQYLAGPDVSKGVHDFYPCLIGESFTDEMKRNLLVFLASKTMVNMEATHCAPLNPALFTPPWSDRSLLLPAAAAGASSDNPNSGGSDSDASWEPI